MAATVAGAVVPAEQPIARHEVCKAGAVLLPLHRRMIRLVDAGLEVHDLGRSEAMFSTGSVFEKVTEFLQGGGSSWRLYFMLDDVRESFLVMSEDFGGSGNGFGASTVWFANMSSGPVDLMDERGISLTYGVVTRPVQALEGLVRSVYLPLLKDAKKMAWGQACSESTHAFVVSLENFAQVLMEGIPGMAGESGLHLPEKPSSSFDDLIELLWSWIASVQECCGDADAQIREAGIGESGPDREIAYWRRRLHRLNCIGEQIKMPVCRQVMRSLRDGSAGLLQESRDSLVEGLTLWKQLDENLTDALAEAKDNVKYLSTLECPIQPLLKEDPRAVLEVLPSLMNAVRMVHSLSRYYNTAVRTSRLLLRVSNRVVGVCCAALTQKEHPDRIWDREPGEVADMLKLCLQVNENYREQYRLQRDKLRTMPRGPQFDFSESQIFYKVDLFCVRAVKLVDLFTTISQYRRLRAGLRIPGLAELLADYESALSLFRVNARDLLDYQSDSFNRDIARFREALEDIEEKLQALIDRSFESAGGIDESLTLLQTYDGILERESLRQDLGAKVIIVFHNYGLELAAVQEEYETHKAEPPFPRDMPPVAGAVLWARHLLRRIEEPMQRFSAAVLKAPSSKPIVKAYNRTASTLVAFEVTWLEAWRSSIDSAKQGLSATILLSHSDSLYVNLDPELLRLLREARCLDRIGVDISEEARDVLNNQDRLKAINNRLRDMLAHFSAIQSRISPLLRPLMAHHVEKVVSHLRPGWTSITWMSMKVDSYCETASNMLHSLENIVSRVCDIVENRIESRLRAIAQTSLLSLPVDETVTLEHFVHVQRESVASAVASLVKRSSDMEDAVKDCIATAMVGQVDADEAARAYKQHYSSSLYVAVRCSIQAALCALKSRACTSKFSSTLLARRPFFVVRVQLSVPSVCVQPSLDDVQSAVNAAAKSVLWAAAAIEYWGQEHLPPESRRTLFDTLGGDLEIIKTVLLLTGSLYGARQAVNDFLRKFAKYDWLWVDNKDVAYRTFLSSGVSFDESMQKLESFSLLESEIQSIPTWQNIAALTLDCGGLKLQLSSECHSWRLKFSQHLRTNARRDLLALLEYVRVMSVRLKAPVTDIMSLRGSVHALKEIREREVSMELEISPILDAYAMLDRYLPEGSCKDKEEEDARMMLRFEWNRLLRLAEDVADHLHDIQADHRADLVAKIRSVRARTKQWREEWDVQLIPSVPPSEIHSLLCSFVDTLELLEADAKVCGLGEELFALSKSLYPELGHIRRDYDALRQLSDIHGDVCAAVTRAGTLPWSEMSGALDGLRHVFAALDMRLKELPSRLRHWCAFKDAEQHVTQYLSAFPVLSRLSGHFMRRRHWDEVAALAKFPFTYEGGEDFQLKDLMSTSILSVRQDIEGICEEAEMQCTIEKQLSELAATWEDAKLETSPYKKREGLFILCDADQVIDHLHESQLQLQSLLAIRHVMPFRATASAQLSTLSSASDMLELWLKVQTMWVSLQSVFVGSDIARRMPVEAKNFAKADRDFIRLMNKANDDGYLALICCGNPYFINSLPVLFAELERCQKYLDGYLEQTRGIFPRFYFVGSETLLTILSRGSEDSRVMGRLYSELFGSIHAVVHDESDGNSISALQGEAVGGAREIVPLLVPVCAHVGVPVEHWLSALEKEMKSTMKSLAGAAMSRFTSMSTLEFAESTSAQMSLLALRVAWTTQCECALMERNKAAGPRGHQAIQEAYQSQKLILDELMISNLKELPLQLDRIKLEGLIALQMHQCNTLSELMGSTQAVISDFEWLKHCRVYWRSQDCIVSAGKSDIKYCHEYVGCTDRLVITPLTERCYVSISRALGLCLGGAFLGPSGAGKTEIVKDLGRTMGQYIITVSCSDRHRSHSICTILKGLCCTGAWCCFEDFDRMEPTILSVIAEQMMAITHAKRAARNTLVLPGYDHGELPLHHQMGYFVTMNPQMRQFTSLPENLKALFREVAVTAPDSEIIIRVKLCCAGFRDFVDLARKADALFLQCEHDLAKPRHDELGLRSMLKAFQNIGEKVRSADNLSRAEESDLVSHCLREYHMPRLGEMDASIFLGILSAIFHEGSLIPELVTECWPLEKQCLLVTERLGLIPLTAWQCKMRRLHEMTQSHTGVIVVGPPGAGKSSIIIALQETLSSSSDTHPIHRSYVNPKALSAGEMFGEWDKLSGEWSTGVFSALWSKVNDGKRRKAHWVICDGPIDNIWFESICPALHSSRTLNLANGNRIRTEEHVKILFEVGDLSGASPAAVSQVGVVYIHEHDVGWKPLIDTWLSHCSEPTSIIGGGNAAHAAESLAHFLPSVLDLMSETKGKAVDRPNQCLVSSTLTLLSSLLESALSQTWRCGSCASADLGADDVERFVLMAIAWGTGGLLSESGRYRLHETLRVLSVNVPPHGTSLYDAMLNPSTLAWEIWPASDWECPEYCGNFMELLVPTVESSRALALLGILQPCRKISELTGPPKRGRRRSSISRRKMSLGSIDPLTVESSIAQHGEVKRRVVNPVLLCGARGAGKTTAAKMHMALLEHDTASRRLNLTAMTTPNWLQSGVEVELSRRSGKVFGPSNGGSLLLFMDDLSMPVADKWGHQPVLELARQLVERGTLAYLDKGRSGDFKTCEDVYYLAAMDLAGAHPGCVPARLLRHFFMFDIGTPSEESILKIFGVVTESRFSCKEAQELEGDYIGALAAQLPSATVSVWKWVCSEMPSYHFSIHDLSRVFEGIFRAPLESISSSHYLGMLWLHECSRAMGDKLCTLVDRERLADKMRSVYRERGLPSRELQGGEEEEVVFVDFLAECGGKLTVRSSIPSYRQCPRISQLRSHITSMLECSEAGIPDQWRNIVLFDDALLHITRISRILFTPGASGVIVGPMGSGKGSAARLAALLADCWVLEPKADGAYDLAALFSDLRDLYKQAGPGKRRVTLLLGESFADRLDLLEAISSLALTGYVPGLFSTDELRLLRMESSGDMILADGAFFQLLAAQIHVLICTNPGEKFGVLQRRFPALLDHCTIYCLLPLSPNALLGAGTTMLARSGVRCEPAIRSLLALHMTAVHSAVIFAGQASEKQSGRTIHVTPQLFEQFISSYALLLSERDAEIDDMSERVCRCLDRVAASAQNVARMQAEALEEAARLADANASTSTVLQQLEESALRSASEADAVASIEASCAAEAARIKVKVKGAQDDLVAASPHLSRAELAVNSIGSDDVRELKTLQKPNDIIKLVFDCIALLRMEKMLAISTTEVTVGIGRDRRTLPFIQDSFKLIQAGMLSNDRFLRELSHFNEHRRDTINEETAELVAPYLELHGLTPDVAANVSKAAEGFCTWVHSMVSYFSASKSVRPKLDAICVAEAALEQMKLQLIDARETAHKYGAAMARLQGDFDNEMKLRRAAEAQAASMQNRADAAEGLMDALAADQERWRDMLQQLSERRRLIVGDAALAAAFLNYCGPFSQGSRKLLLQEFAGDLRARGVPCATEFSALSFFSGAGDCMEWQVQGLPCDHHALENVCLIKQSRSRRPLLLDPDSCALAWLRATIMAATPATAANERSMECDISDSRLHAILELSLSQGYPLVVSGVKSHFDHKILPLLEYPTRVSGFELIFITRLSNPQLSAEAHSRLLLVDFSLTCAGVESKLLDFILQHERSELKRQYEDVLIEQVSALKSENDLNERLLTLIGGDIGSLLDDKELINAVAETAREAANVRRALSTAAEKRANLEGEMDQYRSIAKRATSLYINFDSIPGESDLPAVILDRFLLLLTSAWDEIGRGSIASERNATLVASMNWSAFREAMRARGAKDHPRVILRFATSMLMAESSISAEEVSLLSDIFAQSAIPCQQHEIERLPDGAWGNIRRLNDISLPSVNLADEIRKDEEGWRHWCGESSPEGSSPAPSGPVRSWLLQQNRARSLFLQALIKAALCQPGRALSTLRSLIRDLDEVGSLPALGPQYLEHPSHSLDELLGQMGACAPAIFVVGSTSTPSSQIEQVAHSCCASLKCVSMGEGQTRLARAALHTAVEHGSWLLVQNCHLGIDFIEYLDDMLFAHGRHWHKNLRIFMTTESLAHFPVSLIRSSITVASDVELVL